MYGGARQYSPGEMKARGEERWQESVMQVRQREREKREGGRGGVEERER